MKGDRFSSCEEGRIQEQEQQRSGGELIGKRADRQTKGPWDSRRNDHGHGPISLYRAVKNRSESLI